MTSRHKWDEYKCNPEYECFIASHGSLPTVQLRGTSSHRMPPVQSPTPPKESRPRSPTPHPGVKRTGSGILDEDYSPRKRARTYVQSETESDDPVDEAHPASHFDYTKAKLKREQEKQTRQGNRVRSASFRMQTMLDNLPTLNQDGAKFPSNTFSPEIDELPEFIDKKEKVAMETDPVQTKRRRKYMIQRKDALSDKCTESSDRDVNTGSNKRARFSPSVHSEERIRARRWREAMAGRRTPSKFASTKSKVKERDFWQDVNFDQLKGKTFSLETEETPEPAGATSDNPESHAPSSQDPIYVDSDEDQLDTSFDETDNEGFFTTSPDGRKRATMDDQEDAYTEERSRRLEESRRKMEEINAYEYEKRSAQARAEEQARKQKEEATRRKRREEERKRAEEQRRREEELRRAQAERQQQEQQRRWSNSGARFSEGNFYRTRAPWADEYTSHGGTSYEWFNGFPSSSRTSQAPGWKRGPSSTPKPRWTAQQALERYNKLAVSFDSFKSTPSVAVPPMEEIPWPVLHAPGFTLEQVDWTAVEEFFKQAEILMGGRGHGKAKWKEFLKNSTRRFHPDRWRARGIIGDKGYGSDVEEKVNHVAKVLTPLYRAID